MLSKHCFLGFLVTFFLTGETETQPNCDSLKPQKVHFQSRNFHNILHWQSGIGCTSNSSFYTVQYKIYGEKSWTNKESCSNIQQVFCDLTDETSLVQESYYGRVRMNSMGIPSDWVITKRFTPCWETKIDSPFMNLTRSNQSLLVSLGAPNLPDRAPKEKTMSMEDYYELVYRVFITNKFLKKEQMIYEGTHRVVEIEAVAPHMSYCVVAEMYQPMFDRRSQRSKKICVEIS
ncbi:interleukin-22 receptor subunit alpha-2 [Suncus etruscus]|uniref:interleukin-22 receptor subunit alpha-2 n=1 Tax=Suncus etruscus TaxID=109475 RepID=UPI002110D5B8|nr:interleukin-22 receptor subunit alpha-2 [Suncus etruscus]